MSLLLSTDYLNNILAFRLARTQLLKLPLLYFINIFKGFKAIY
jgi:hypothetical protein